MDDDLPDYWRCNYKPEDEPPELATYRTSNGNNYNFSFEWQKDFSIRPYIECMPSYGSRDTSVYKTHRLYDGSRPYVCWDTSLRSMDDAKKVAANWARRTDRY